MLLLWRDADEWPCVCEAGSGRGRRDEDADGDSSGDDADEPKSAVGDVKPCICALVLLWVNPSDDAGRLGVIFWCGCGGTSCDGG